MLRKTSIFVFIVALFVVVGPVLAVSPAGQQYISQIVGGDMASLKQASQNIYRNKVIERPVLDVVAEKLLQNYNDTSRTGVDAAAWACKALGKSNDARYRNVLITVSTTAAHPKTKKYAQQSLDAMSQVNTDAPYQKGTVDLEAMRKKLLNGQSPVPVTQQPQAQTPPPQARPSGKFQPLSKVRQGMSMQEVTATIGPPTSTGGHPTGQAFNPFYDGGDTVRVIHLYQGQGRVVYSRDASYAHTWRVMEVQINPSETGYP